MRVRDFRKISVMYKNRGKFPLKMTKALRAECFCLIFTLCERYIARRGDVGRKKDQAEQLPQTLPRAANRYGNLLRLTRSPQETAEQCFAFRHRRNIAKRADKNIPWNVRNSSSIFTASGNTHRAKSGNFAFSEYLLALRLASELADLRAANANPCDIRRWVRGRTGHHRMKKALHLECFFLW